MNYHRIRNIKNKQEVIQWKKLKKQGGGYKKPVVRVVKFETEDVILASGNACGSNACGANAVIPTCNGCDGYACSDCSSNCKRDCVDFAWG